MKNFLFLGGDMRSIYAAKRLGERYDCFIYGFSEPLPVSAANVSVLREITKAGNLVLPLPACFDGFNINAPYFKAPLPIELIPLAVYGGGTVYCGKSCPAIEQICAANNLKLIDYFEREELAVMNAVPTSEGCLEIIMRESSRTIFGSSILLTGFGRISKVLAKHLTALGAKITVTARKYCDLSWAQIAGCETVHLSKLDNMLEKFDTIINTVPAPLFDARRLKRLKPDCLIVDLASVSGVEDIETAKKEGVNVIHALSLPGKVAPATAGNIVADTIMNILAEMAENGEPGGGSNA
ncbi:MAG: dipicolinic acid synthetase [Oscillospiraceae bacterium]|jgi:dipicolinate synthase subunit A|nr:dipicolinic acid synthetase [Oscillospiraceae bacterium]